MIQSPMCMDNMTIGLRWNYKANHSLNTMKTGTFVLTTEYVQANNLLKIVWLVESSGAGKEVIRLGLVTLNGVRLEEMRKKLIPWDVIVFEETAITVVAGNLAWEEL